MSLQSEHPPQTWDRIEQLAAAGTKPEAPRDSKCFRRWCTASNLCIDCQPEAHDPHTCDWFGRFTCRVCGKHRDQPEAPKGPAAEADPVKECANCGCVTHGHQMLCCESPLECGHRRRVEYWREACQKSERDLAAANARIAELEARLAIGPRNSDEVQIYIEEGIKVETEVCRHERDLANARADAAELAVETWVATERDAYAGIETERDQLAARVTSMQGELDIAWADDDPKETCTPEERKVLEQCEALTIDPDGEGLLRGELDALCEAILANRAAKAKREAT